MGLVYKNNIKWLHFQKRCVWVKTLHTRVHLTLNHSYLTAGCPSAEHHSVTDLPLIACAVCEWLVIRGGTETTTTATTKWTMCHRRTVTCTIHTKGWQESIVNISNTLSTWLCDVCMWGKLITKIQLYYLKYCKLPAKLWGLKSNIVLEQKVTQSGFVTIVVRYALKIDSTTWALAKNRCHFIEYTLVKIN